MYQEQKKGETVTHLSKVEARSGSHTLVTRNILFISLALVVALLVAALAFGFFNTAKTGADKVSADNGAQAATTN